MKFLTLIQAIALLHQHQREIKTSTRRRRDAGIHRGHRGRREAGVGACQPCADALARRAADRRRARLLLLIDKMVKSECERLADRAAATTASRGARCGSTPAGATRSCEQHLRRLEELEYLCVHRGGSQGQLSSINFEMDETASRYCRDCARAKRSTSRGRMVELRGWVLAGTVSRGAWG